MEVGWIVGPIPVNNGGKEVIVRYLRELTFEIRIFAQNAGFAPIFLTRVNSSLTQMEDR